MSKHVLVIFNPSAKSQVQTEQWLGELVQKLNEKEEYIVSFYPTTAQTAPETLVPLFKPPLDLIVAAGGDGTVRFALAALAKTKLNIPCAILPLGTGNLLARNLGIVEEGFFADPLEHAFDYILNGRPMRMDMAMVNGEYFAGVAGMGPLSEAFVSAPRDAKTKLKLLAYVAEFIKTLALPPSIFKITTGGKSFKLHASGVFISNIEDLGINKVNDLKNLTDGMLTLRVVHPRNFKDYVALGFRHAGGKLGDPTPEYLLPVKEAMVEVEPRKGPRSAFQELMRNTRDFIVGKHVPESRRSQQTCIMIDGEQSGVAPMRVTVIPQAVTVLVPAQQIESEHVQAA